MMIYMIREGRHVGLALGLDSVRYYAIDIRSMSDYMILKSQGLDGLTSDLHWLYSYFDPIKVRNMPPQNFIILSRSGAIGIGQFAEVPWHKQERENILKAVGLKVEYGEPLEAGEYRGTFKTIGDQEHAEAIRLYLEEELSMEKIAEKMGRSSGSIHGQIKKHNRVVKQTGSCPACRRVGSGNEAKMGIRASI